jgi:GABA(A) receptor-associated protein
MSFKNQYSFDKRVLESKRIITRFPNRIPIICEKSKNQTSLPALNKVKYLVPADLTIGQFICVIRNRMKLSSQVAIFLTIEGYIPPSLSLIGELYQTSKYADGFLYIEYSSENTFGSHLL